jgi:hypothetical protein
MRFDGDAANDKLQLTQLLRVPNKRPPASPNFAPKEVPVTPPDEQIDIAKGSLGNVLVQPSTQHDPFKGAERYCSLRKGARKNAQGILRQGLMDPILCFSLHLRQGVRLQFRPSAPLVAGGLTLGSV